MLSTDWIANGFRAVSAARKSQQRVREFLAVSGCLEIKDGVGVIRADSLAAVAYNLGQLNGLTRLYQMDLLRAKMRGNLSDFLGIDYLSADSATYAFGFDYYARKITSGFTSRDQALLNAYTAGVNDAAVECSSWEHDLSGTTFRQWSPEDSVLCLQDYFVQLSETLGSETAEMLRYNQIPIMGTGIDFDGRQQPGSSYDEWADHLSSFQSQERNAEDITIPRGAEGSNGWATQDGDKAWLANDIHLGLTYPNALMAVRIEGSGDMKNAFGFVLPGLPAFVSGTTDKLAWGMTRLCSPVAVNEYPESEPMSIIESRYFGSERVTRRLTEYGPISNDTGKVLRWTAFSPECVNLRISRLLESDSVAAALENTQGSGGPPVSVLLADSAGNIGWMSGGRFYKDAAREGSELVTEQHMPVLYNPASGLLVACNQQTTMRTADGSPVTVNGYPDCRARRAAEMLRRTSQDWELHASVQLDLTDDFYTPWVAMLKRSLATEHVPKGWHYWNKQIHSSSRDVQSLILTQALVASELTLGVADYAKQIGAKGFGLHSFNSFLLSAVATEDDRFLPSQHESMKKLVQWCFETARLYLQLNQQSNRSKWGQFNSLKVSHPLAAQLGFAALLAKHKSGRQGGTPQTLRVASSSFGAASRLIVEFNDVGAVVHFSSPGRGSSNFLLSAERRSLRAWLKGRYEREVVSNG